MFTSPGSSEAAPPVAGAARAGAAKADAERRWRREPRKTAEGGAGGAGAVDQLMNLKFLWFSMDIDVDVDFIIFYMDNGIYQILDDLCEVSMDIDFDVDFDVEFDTDFAVDLWLLHY